jgi:hypothetical protein
VSFEVVNLNAKDAILARSPVIECAQYARHDFFPDGFEQ